MSVTCIYRLADRCWKNLLGTFLVSLIAHCVESCLILNIVSTFCFLWFGFTNNAQLNLAGHNVIT